MSDDAATAEAPFPFGVSQSFAPKRRRRRLPWNPSTVPIARAQAYLALGAALISFAGILLPHPSTFNLTGLLAVQVVTLSMGIGLLVFAGRLPIWALTTGPEWATALTTVAIFFTGDATSAYALFYLWIGLYSFYFGTRRQAMFHIAFACVCYSIAIAFVGDPPAAAGEAGAIHHLVVTIGTLVVGGALLLYLRGRVEALMGRLTDAARTDLLTGLLNARGVSELLETELERAKLNGSMVSLVVLNPDRFREVNDRLGRDTGDEVLKGIARLAEQVVRRIDSVARTSGGEFAIVMPETTQDEAYVVAEQLLTRVRNGFQDREVSVTMSCGVASYPRHASTAAELFTAADDALFAAQALGRDRAVVSSPEVETVMQGVIGPRATDAGSHLATVLSLAEALDLREESTASHSQTVGRYCEMMGRELGLGEKRIERLRLAGILHDIGKVGIPDSILLKPGPLDEDEWAHMRRHPELGARILGSRQLADIREWVMASHERPDGRGYPRGLRDDEIPLEARIVAVADAYEAMTSDRVYRPGMSPSAARSELERWAGAQFDAEVVDAFLKALRAERSGSRSRV